MGFIKSLTVVTLSASIFILTCLTIIHLVFFLSSLPDTVKDLNLQEYQRRGGGKSIFSNIFMNIMTNVTLICVFILQHSFLIQPMKTIAKKLSVPVLERSFYNLASSIALLTLIFCWKKNPSYALWYIDVQNNHTLKTVYISIHTITWLIIYVGIVCMDVAELFGIKQVIKYLRDEPKFFECKSRGLVRFQKHMRHPSLVGFLIILWVFPFMSIDRLLLASLWSIYMIIAWKPDIGDYNYLLRQQLIKKLS